MAWIYLVIAGLLETCWAIGLKKAEGFTKLGWSLFTLVTLVASMFLLARAVKNNALPMGTAYAVWVGIGALGAAVLGIFLFGESANPGRLVCLGLLVVAIVGLKFTAT